MQDPKFRVKKIKESSGDIIFVLYEKKEEVTKFSWLGKRYYWHKIGSYISRDNVEKEILKRATKPCVLDVEDYDDRGRAIFYGWL